MLHIKGGDLKSFFHHLISSHLSLLTWLGTLIWAVISHTCEGRTFSVWLFECVDWISEGCILGCVDQHWPPFDFSLGETSSPWQAAVLGTEIEVIWPPIWSTLIALDLAAVWLLFTSMTGLFRTYLDCLRLLLEAEVDWVLLSCLEEEFCPVWPALTFLVRAFLLLS